MFCASRRPARAPPRAGGGTDLFLRGGVDVPEPSESPPAAGLTRILSLVMIALMLGSIIYAAWIALVNWSHIGV